MMDVDLAMREGRERHGQCQVGTHPGHGGYKGHRVSSQIRPSPGDLPCVRAQLATEDEEPVPDLHASGAGGCREGPGSSII